MSKHRLELELRFSRSYWTLAVDGSPVTGHVVEIPIAGFVPGTAVGSSATAADFPFLAGPENQLLATVLNDLLPSPTHSVSPLAGKLVLLCGPTGTGKTHLACGICKKWQAVLGDDSSLYLSARQYREELIAAIDTNQVATLRERWRSLKLLVIDDIHRFPSDAYLNEDFLHTIDLLVDSKATLLLTSAVSPGLLMNLSLAIRSRLSSGYSLSLAPPGLAARCQVVKQIAANLDRQLSDSSATLIANQTTGTTNDIAGVIGQMIHGEDALNSLTEDEITQFFRTRSRRYRPKFSDIVRVVGKHYGVPQKTLKGSSRRRSVVVARGMVIYLSREILELSFDRIGRALSGRDHTTIMHSFRKIEQLAKTDLATRQTIADLRRLLHHHHEISL